jgi:hypothetical protein
MIPGAYERRPVRDREPGSLGGAPFGSDGISTGPGIMSDRTILEREKEGGGGASQRPRPDR